MRSSTFMNPLRSRPIVQESEDSLTRSCYAGPPDMTNQAVRRHLTDRDAEILLAIDRCPLTPAQLLKLSVTFTQFFQSLRSVQERLQKMRDAGWVRPWPYATMSAGGSPLYSRLTPLGYALLHGRDSPPPTKRHFSEIALAHQRHTFALAEFIVHTVVSAHHSSLRMARFYRENTLRMNIDGTPLLPDCAFELHAPDRRQYNFVVELDNSTESIESPKYDKNWQQKIVAYDRLQERSQPHRFRVLVITTRSRARLDHILAAAAQHAANPQRRLFLGAPPPAYLAQPPAVAFPCFRAPPGALAPLGRAPGG